MFLGRTLAVIGVVGGAAWAVSKYLKAQQANGALAGNSADSSGSVIPGDGASRSGAPGAGVAASSPSASGTSARRETH